MYLGFFVFCAIFSQEIASLSYNNNTDSLDIHVRMKRLIDRTPTGFHRPKLIDIGYVVDVLSNGIHACSGTILSPHVILTIASCVLDFVRYTVRSGTVSRTGGSIHLVNGILSHPNYVLDSFENNIALLSILEPIILASGFNRRIHIYDLGIGDLPPNTTVTVSGWGQAINFRHNRFFPKLGGGRIEYPDEMRSIDVPTINLNQCQNHHNFNADIHLNKLICTYHAQKMCARGDDGNPLTYQGYLVGVLILCGNNRPSNRPDVFLNVILPEYKNWIISHMTQIPSYPHIQHEAVHNPAVRPGSSSSTKVHPGHF